MYLSLVLLITFEFITNSFTTLNVPTVIWWLLNTAILLLTVYLIIKYNYKNDTNLLIVKLFIFWNIISILKGFFYAETYLHWKALIDNSFVLLTMPMFVFLFINETLLKEIIARWFKYMPFLVFLFIPFMTSGDFVGRYLAPFTLFLLLFPLLNKKWKLITIFFLFIVIIAGGLEARSNVIKFSIAASLGLLFYIKFLINSKLFFRFTHFLFMIAPIIIIVLAFSGIFNIFQMDKYLGNNYQTNKESLTMDTRSFIYKETIESAIKYEHILFGRTPARGYDSPFFGWYLKWELGTGSAERPSSEVSILNFFNWNGIVGAFLYFLIFAYSSYLAIYRSGNFYIKIIGLFVAFRWAYAFVEDFTKFDIQYVFLWVFISMCLSSSFRRMSNEEFRSWTQDVLNKTKLIKFRD